MARRYFNWKLAVVLVIGLVVLATTAFGLRQWQRSRRSEQGLDLGNKAYEEHRWREAAANLGRYLGVERDDVPVLLKYADAHLHIRPLRPNNVQQAVAAYRAVLRINKDNSEAATRLTELYLQMGMPGEAELIATRALETGEDPKLTRMLAMALARQRKFHEAAAELKEVIAEHPEQILAYQALGQLTELRPEEFPDSNNWFDQAVQSNPASALAYVIRANFHLRNKDKAKALADLEQAEKLDLSEPDVRLRLAIEFMNANVLDKAEEHLAAVQEAEPANQDLWQTWAQLAQQSKSETMMQKVAESGLKELSSQPWDFMPAAVELFIRADELDRAADCISKLRENDIAPAVVAFLEGLLAETKGQSHEAVKCWRRAIQLGDNTTRTRLALVSALSRLGDTRSALQQLRTLVSERPDSFAGRLALAKLLAQTGNWSETLEHSRRAAQLSPENLEAALLYLQSRIQVLAARSTSQEAVMWQDIDKQLAGLEKATDGALEVKLVQFQRARQDSNFADAEVIVAELKQAHSSELRVDLAEFQLLTDQKKDDEAISKLDEITKKFPQETEPVAYLAVLLDQQENREKCEGIIQDALTRMEGPVSQRTLCFLLADLYSRWGREEKAYELVTSFADKLPNDIPVQRRLLRYEQVMNEPGQAQRLVDNIKSLEGEDGWQWRYEQARIWFAGDDFESRYPQIISLLQENLLAGPDDQGSRMLLAAAYERAGEMQLAISTYRDALSRSPDHLSVIIPAVAALYKARDYEQADELLNRAAQQNLSHPQLDRLQLQSHLRRGQLGYASDVMENLLTKDPNDKALRLSLTLLKMRQSEFDEAGELLAQLMLQDPNSLSVKVAQIELNVRQGKSDEALLLCDEIVANFKNASAYALRGRTYAMLGQREKAKKDYEYATAIEPNNVQTWVAKSDFYSSIGYLDEAISSIQKAMSLEPDGLGIQMRAISLFSASSSPDEVRKADSILDKALALNPQDINLRLSKARSLLAQRTAPAIENATKILEKITEDQPKVVEAWLLLGELSLNQGQPGNAIDAALRGLVHNANDKMLLLLKARAEAERSPALAIPTLNVLRKLDPNDADITVFLARTYIKAGNSERAVNLLKNELSTSDVSIRRRYEIALAFALYKNGDKAGAQKRFDSLYQSEPNDPGPLFAQVQLLNDDKLWSQLSQTVTDWCENHPNDTRTPMTIAGDLAATEGEDADEARKTAEDILRMTLQRNPSHTGATAMLATLLQTTGRTAESAELYQRILALQPDNVIAVNNLAWILCEEQGKYQQALELAQKGLKIAPNYVDLIDTRGVAYYRLGELEKAVQDFTQSIQLYPAGAPSVVASHFHLGRTLANLGRKDQAIESLRKASELNTKTKVLSATDAAEMRRLLDELSQGT